MLKGFAFADMRIYLHKSATIARWRDFLPDLWSVSDSSGNCKSYHQFFLSPCLDHNFQPTIQPYRRLLGRLLELVRNFGHCASALQLVKPRLLKNQPGPLWARSPYLPFCALGVILISLRKLPRICVTTKEVLFGTYLMVICKDTSRRSHKYGVFYPPSRISKDGGRHNFSVLAFCSGF